MFVALFYRVSVAAQSICLEAARQLTHRMARPFAVTIRVCWGHAGTQEEEQDDDVPMGDQEEESE